MVSSDTIIELAVCSCGHEIARHDAHGCPGARATFCMCRMTPSAALDAAIERVRWSNLSSRANFGAMRVPARRRTSPRPRR